jgi:hypothetical protein
MAITYKDLKQQIIRYAKREENDTNFVSLIPVFVSMGMERIYREATDLGMEEVADATFEQGKHAVRKPNNWNQTLSFYYGTPENAELSKTFLYERPYEFCQAWCVDSAPLLGRPLYYTDDPAKPYEQFLVVPAPDQAYKAKVIYTLQAPSLQLGHEEGAGELEKTWAFQRAPSLVFYASYVEALPFIDKKEDLPVFEGLYQRTLEGIRLQHQKRGVDRTSNSEKG